MNIRSIKTEKIIPNRLSLIKILDKYLENLPEKSILVITSKIVAICEGRVVKIGKIEKDDLIKQEAEFYLPREISKYNFFLSIKNNILLPSAGIDESNGNGYYILWPQNPQNTANKIREYLKKRFKLKNIGVLITDSKTTPLRWGTTGVGVAHSGFAALNNYIGKPDIFGHNLQVTKANVMDALSAAAVLVMGEGKEQTPLAVVEDLSFVHFQDRIPTKRELNDLKISIEDDLYAPILTKVDWLKGNKT